MSESRNGLLRILKNFTTRRKIDNQFMVPENISFDNEYYNDIIKKLKEEIKAKNKEIQLLKVSKTKRDDEYQRMMRVIQEIINKSDSSTIKGMQIIDQNFSEKKKIKSEITSIENI
jgi:sigma54-dependent transcription regulator